MCFLGSLGWCCFFVSELYVWVWVWIRSPLVGKKILKQGWQKKRRLNKVKVESYCEFILPLLLRWGKHFQSPALPNRVNSTRKSEAQSASTQTFFFLSYTNSYCASTRHKRLSSCLRRLKYPFFSVFIYFFSLWWQKMSDLTFIPIQIGAREKWFGLNGTTVLFCSVLLDVSAGLRVAGSRATFVAFGSPPDFT